MSIEKYTTESLILAQYDYGESDAIFKIYTRDFGVVSARQASYKKSSKLRAHIVVGRLTNITLVKGKEFYRIAGARESLEDKNFNREIVANVIEIINRFLGFENKNIKLFDRIISYLNIKNLDIVIIRLCVVAEVLIIGGFLNTEDIGMSLEEYKTSSIDDIYLNIVNNKVEIVQKLRGAIEASML